MILMETKDNLSFFLNAAEDSSKPEKCRGRKKEKMKEELKKLLEEMEGKRGNHNKELEKLKKEFKDEIDKDTDAIILATDHNVGVVGEVYEVLTLFAKIAQSLMKNGIDKEMLKFNVELATLEEGSETYGIDALELMLKHFKEKLEDEDE